MQPGVELLSSFKVPDRLACEGISQSLEQEWLAENAVFYFNAIYMTYTKLAFKNSDWDAACKTRAGGFPKKVRFNWKANDRGRRKEKTKNAKDYIEKALKWIEEIIVNESIFSQAYDKPFPTTFQLYINRIFVLYFRIATILVGNDSLQNQDDEKEAVMLLRSILYFGWFWDLINSTDTQGIMPDVISNMSRCYRKDFLKLITR